MSHNNFAESMVSICATPPPPPLAQRGSEKRQCEYIEQCSTPLGVPIREVVDMVCGFATFLAETSNAAI